MTNDGIYSASPKRGRDLTPEIVDRIIEGSGVKLIDPLSDFGFKRMLGSEQGKMFAIPFLNAMIGDDTGPITDLRYLPTERVGLGPASKRVTFDCFLHTQDGKQIIVEVQRSRQKHYAKRVLAYTSRAVSGSVTAGDLLYESVPKVISLNLMDYNMKEFRGHEEYFWRICMKDGHNRPFCDDLVWYFVEMRKFASKLTTEETRNERGFWLHMLKNIQNMREEDFSDRDPLFLQFFNKCKITNLNTMEKKEYVEDLFDFDDLQDTIDCAKEDSFAEGVEHGFEKGIEKGIEKGRKRQIEDLILSGVDPAVIASALNMTPEQLIAFCTQ